MKTNDENAMLLTALIKWLNKSIEENQTFANTFREAGMSDAELSAAAIRVAYQNVKMFILNYQAGSRKECVQSEET